VTGPHPARRCAWLVAAVLLLLAAVAPVRAAEYPLLIANGTIVDGSGKQRYVGDVAVRDGRIVAVGNLDEGKAGRLIDARGLVVAPGFIDVHSHADRAFDDPAAASIEGFVRQGVTTAVIGVDGDMDLDKLGRYVALADAGQIGVNFMSYIGHNSIREAVIGGARRAPTDAELAAMQAMVREGMLRGTIGLSSGLMYLPGNYATADELVALAATTRPYGGRYDSHDRDPVNDLMPSLQECLDTARAAGVPAHPAHLKAVGSRNFGKGPEIVRLIESRIAGGEQITTDAYPYDGAATRPVIALLYPGDDARGRALALRLQAISAGKAPPSAMGALAPELAAYWQDLAPASSEYSRAVARTEQPDEGVFSWVASVGYASMRIVVSRQPEYEGRMVTELAQELGITPFELFRRLVVAEGSQAMVTLGAIQEDDVRIILRQPWTMVASDGEELNPSHPRARGTFARLLGRYVRQWQVLELEDAIHKVTGLPAAYLNLADRGRIEAGAIADIVVFDPATVIDRATWAQPGLVADGVRHVLIQGQWAVEDGRLTQSRLGRFIPFQRAGAGSRNEAQEALEFVVQKVRSVQPDTRTGFSAETEAALAEARRNVSRVTTDDDLLRVVNQFLVSLHDGHTEVRLSDAALAADRCADLPLSWLPDGLIFTDAVEQIARGDRLVELGGYDPDSLLRKFRSITPVENEDRLKYQAARRLGIGSYLRALGLVAATGHLQLVTESSSGRRTLSSVPMGPCATPATGAGVTVDFFDEASLAVFRFERFEYDKEMAAKIERFFQVVHDRRFRNVAIDLRGNDGGDSTVAFDFLQYLAEPDYRAFSVDVRISDELTAATPAFGREAMSAVFETAGLPPIAADAGHYLLPGDLVKGFMLSRLVPSASAVTTRAADRRLFMITDAGTFSSGNLFAILLRDNGIGTLVGEPTGNEINFSGSELRFPIPGTGLYLNVSSSTMIRPDASRGNAPAIEPDIPVATRRSDVAAGRDPPLDYLRSHATGAP
jgi:N-acyl-D-aspartate/D-glutamate deacylase